MTRQSTEPVVTMSRSDDEPLTDQRGAASERSLVLYVRHVLNRIRGYRTSPDYLVVRCCEKIVIISSYCNKCSFSTNKKKFQGEIPCAF